VHAAAVAQVWGQERVVCVKVLPLLQLPQHWYVPCTCIKVHTTWEPCCWLQQVTYAELTLTTWLQSSPLLLLPLLTGSLWLLLLLLVALVCVLQPQLAELCGCCHVLLLGCCCLLLPPLTLPAQGITAGPWGSHACSSSLLQQLEIVLLQA
jgi:hypothetical protein